MTIDKELNQAIIYHKKMASIYKRNHNDSEGNAELKLVEWLEELKRLREQELCEDVVSRAEAIRICKERGHDNSAYYIEQLPSVTPKIVRCKDCKYWKQQINYRGVPFSFGFCESDDMWRSLYGETYEVAHIVTDDDHYCGYAERRTE